MTIYAGATSRPDRARPARPTRGPGRPPGRRRPEPRQHPSYHDPVWAKLLLILGPLVMVVSGAAVVVPKVLAGWATDDINKENLLDPGLRAQSIEGPINILLLGMDERKGSHHTILTDTIMIAHVPATHDAVYLVSIPRDSRVEIPPFPETKYSGGTDKINAAFAWGNRKPNGRGGWTGDPSTAGRQRGVQLVAQTINNLVPGGLKFNAVAIINFDGFRAILDAIDGVQLCVDERTTSVMYDHNNKYHTFIHDLSQRKVYEEGCRHFEGWEALDYARQRYNVTGGDYGRQRHQQQLLMAIFRKLLSKGVLTDLGAVTQLQKVAGDLLTLDLGDTSIENWAFTLRNIRGDSVTMIKTNAGRPNSQRFGNVSYEILTDESMQLLAAVPQDTVYDFLVRHPDWIVPDKQAP